MRTSSRVPHAYIHFANGGPAAIGLARPEVHYSGTRPEPLADSTICDTHIPAGTQLLLLLRYPNMGEHPDDGFDPDRLLQGDESSAPKLLTFGAGPRFCPGRNLAFLEAKTALAMIARNFQIELDSTAGPVKEHYNFAVIPDGLRVRLHESRSPRSADASAKPAESGQRH
jgi:cytochrome P450